MLMFGVWGRGGGKGGGASFIPLAGPRGILDWDRWIGDWKWEGTAEAIQGIRRVGGCFSEGNGPKGSS